MNFRDLPKEIQQKMLHNQELQGNSRNAGPFHRRVSAMKSEGGFNWDRSPEGESFWDKIISFGRIDLFYEKYPLPEVKTYPRVMMVSEKPISIHNPGSKRVVFMEKLGKFVAWECAETLEEANRTLSTCPWSYAEDIPEEPEKELETIVHIFLIQI